MDGEETTNTWNEKDTLMSGNEYYSDDAGLRIQYGDFQDDEISNSKDTDKSITDHDFYVGDDDNDDEYFDDEIKKSDISYNDDKSIFYNKNRPSLEYLEKQQQKQHVKEKSLKEDDDGSGNFSNTDDDDDDNSNDHDKFFISDRKTNYFRKNTNDAIKIISTPHGKVGIVYQQTSIENSIPSETTKFNQQQKITPVLTPDGKVALLYRGASENTKYEPMLNGTLNQKFNTKEEINDDNKTSASKFEMSNLSSAKNYGIKFDYDTTTEDLGYDDDEEEIAIKDTINPSLEIPSRVMEKATIIQTTHLRPQLAIEYENPILPNINRPLSEVLGIKKNQFKQFRIKDEPTTTSTTTWLPQIFKDNRDNDNDEIILGDLNRRFVGGLSSSSIDYLNKNSLTDINGEYDEKNFDSNRPSDDAPNSDGDDFMTNNEFLSKSEVVNLAIIPHFDEEFELIQQQRYKEQYAAAAGNGLHYHQRYRYRHFNHDLTSVHCIMQALMGLAAISTVFGMLGAFFKQRVIDQFRTMHW